MHALYCSPIAQFFSQYLYFILSTSKKSRCRLQKSVNLEPTFTGPALLSGQDRPQRALGPHSQQRKILSGSSVLSILSNLHILSIEFSIQSMGSQSTQYVSTIERPILDIFTGNVTFVPGCCD